MDTVELAAILLDLARRVRLQAFRKGPRTPKKPNPQGKKTPRKGHVSTAQLLIVPLQRRISMPIMPQRSGVPCAENVPPFAKDQYVCQSNHRIAEAVTGVRGRAPFPSCPFYHPSSSRCRFGHPREAAVCAGNFPDSNGISDYFKKAKTFPSN